MMKRIDSGAGARRCDSMTEPVRPPRTPARRTWAGRGLCGQPRPDAPARHEHPCLPPPTRGARALDTRQPGGTGIRHLGCTGTSATAQGVHRPTGAPASAFGAPGAPTPWHSGTPALRYSGCTNTPRPCAAYPDRRGRKGSGRDNIRNTQALKHPARLPACLPNYYRAAPTSAARAPAMNTSRPNS